MTPQCTACFTVELVNTADKAIANMSTLNIDVLLAQVKTVAVKPVAVGILRTAAHSAKQAAGKRFQAFATKVRGLMTNCDYVDPCPHAPVPAAGEVQAMACNVASCTGTDYTASILRTILLAGIYDSDIRRSILGTIGIERKPVEEVINLVEMKEAACDASGTARPAAAAASTSSYKRDRTSAKSSPPPRQ